MRKILDVVLDEASHTYSDSNNLKYDSFSKMVSHFKEPFDPYKVMGDGGTLIGNYVLKNGGTEQYWLDMWENNKNKACVRGSAFHKIKEDLANHADFFKHNSRDYPTRYFNQVTDQNPGIDYSQLPDGAYQELTIFNRRWMIAGQADKVIKDHQYVDIDDYKTNGNFETVSYKPPRGSYRMMKRPVGHHMDCHLGHYTMQLSVYGWMLEQFGLIVRQLRVLHYLILEEDEKRIMKYVALKAEDKLKEEDPTLRIEPSVYLIKYDRDGAEAMIKHYRNQINRLTW